MIDFNTVAREFRGLVDRRREIFTFLGSAFAAMGLFLANVLEGKLPPSLHSVQEHIFAFYALVLMVISLLLALRMAKLHGGMVLNGILYGRLMQEQDFTRKGDPQRAARHNLFGVSFIQFVLVDLIAGFSMFLLVLAIGQTSLIAYLSGLGVFLCWMLLYFRFHHSAAEFAIKMIAWGPVGQVKHEDWREHVSASMHQANHGLLAELAFAGLMIFSCFGAMSGLGKIEANKIDLGAELVKKEGPVMFALLMAVTCLLELVIYLRVRVAIGKFSLQLDPTDRPFRPLKLTDSLLGYLLLAFLFGVSLHVLLIQAIPSLGENLFVLLGIDAAAVILAAVAEQMTLVIAGKKS
jgi:hypothetical protein